MLGRVATQTNANDATWSYFFAGYRSEEIALQPPARALEHPFAKAQNLERPTW